MELTILIPVLNEEQTIGTYVKKAMKFTHKYIKTRKNNI